MIINILTKKSDGSPLKCLANQEYLFPLIHDISPEDREAVTVEGLANESLNSTRLITDFKW